MEREPRLPDQPWLLHGWIEHTQLLLASYCHWVGEELISRAGSEAAQAERLFDSSLIVVSHGVEDDPILNYGNRAALALWEMDIETLRRTPSRETAEPVHRDERARLLARTTRDGFVDDYSGIRISSSGRRFCIARATVWNLRDARGDDAGQAAMFSRWHYLATN